jgi:hypothetical protein
MRRIAHFAAGLLLLSNFVVRAQTIEVHSVSDVRGSNTNSGYTLDGSWMSSSARLKLLNTANFGSTGTYSKSVRITDSYSTSGSLTQVTSLSYNTLFFFGSFDKNDPNLAQFTTAEVDSIYRWSKRGGKMIICAGQQSDPNMPPYDSRVLDSKWGISWVSSNPSYLLPTTAGSSTSIFNGTFGASSSANEGGYLQGYFSPVTPGNQIFATSTNGMVTLMMDCATLDLIVADVDAYTSIGNVTSNASIMNDQDKFWANTIAFMDQLQPLPQLSYNNSSLSLNASYLAYQWYHNNQPITGAVSAGYAPSQPGSYAVEVTFNGGCKQKSSAFLVEPTGIGDAETGVNCTRIYPNPLRTSAVIEFEHDVMDVQIQLVDAFGKTLREQIFSGRMLEILRSELPTGIYSINITYPGRSVQQQRIIID